MLALKIIEKNIKEVVMIPKMIRNLVKVEVIRHLVLILHFLEVEIEIVQSGREKITISTWSIRSTAISRTTISLTKKNQEQMINKSTEMDAKTERNYNDLSMSDFYKTSMNLFYYLS